MNKLFTYIAYLSICACLFSCKGFLDTTPTDSVIDKNAMSNLYDAGVVTNGLYTELKYYRMYGTHFAQMGDMRADNLCPKDLNGNGAIIYNLEYDSETKSYFSLWEGYYSTIMRANTLIENIDNVATKNDSEVKIKNDYLGQAYAVRALCFFDIARLYGYPYLYDNGASLGAVILTKTVSAAEAKIPRSSVAETYKQAFSDLDIALNLLSKKKNNGHFNYWAAKLLQARLYLYKGDYELAFNASVEVINDSPYRYVSNSEYLDYWGRECDDESVLELLITTEGDIDDDGGFLTIYHNLWFDDKNAGGSIIPTKKWVSLFENTPNDIRGKMIAYDDPTTGAKGTGELWLRKFIGNKDLGYTFRRNNPRVMRITEAYLIAAEAGLEINNPKASDYLNIIRKRADPTATDIVATLELIQTERQKEFIGEGHRFFDILRRGGIISREENNYTFSWDYDKIALPISRTERISYTELQQNPGYKE